MNIKSSAKFYFIFLSSRFKKHSHNSHLSFLVLSPQEMAEDNQASPLAPFQVYGRSDEEIATVKNLKKERSNKCFVYVFAGVVILCAIALIFSLVVFREKTPTVRLSSVTVARLSYGRGNGSSSQPFFNVTLAAEIAIRNQNFGDFEYESSSASVIFGGISVGETRIGEGRAKARQTKRMNVTMEGRSWNGQLDMKNVSSDIDSGMLELSSYAKLKGRLRLMDLVKKRITADMNCTMTLRLKIQEIQDLVCS